MTRNLKSSEHWKNDKGGERIKKIGNKRKWQKSTKDITQQKTEALKTLKKAMITVGRASRRRKEVMAKHSIDLANKFTQVRKPPKKLSFVIDIISKD